MLDLLLRGGTLADGTGAPAVRADVGIREGRIVAVGDVDEPARMTVDVGGLIVAPGFVDIHTHFDAQVFWDPMLTPSPLHGVTTVAAGNCGFTIAPLAASESDYLMRMLARVEGMPLESLRVGVPWDWTSFAEYLDRLEGRVGLNCGFLVGHSALRRAVMGARAVGETASPREVERMQALLHESLAAGGLGFSSSLSPTHNDGAGQPVPSRFASREELLALAEVVREYEGTTLEFIPGVGRFSEEQMDLMAALSLAACRPLNWNLLVISSLAPDAFREQLAASDYAAVRGATVKALTLPQNMTMRINLVSGFIFDALPGWAEVIGLPLEERKRAFADLELRRRLDERAKSEEAGVFRFIAHWENLRIDQTYAPANAGWKGRTVGELAAQTGKNPFDAMLDLALSDDLRTSFMPPIPGDDDESWRLRVEAWRDPRAIVGGSDAGAHLDMIDTFACTTRIFEEAVRKRGLIPLEEVVRLLTDVPARFYGLRERGRIAVAWHADLVVFDPQRIGPQEVEMRYDLPGGASRLYAGAEGIEHVYVNGVEVVRGGALTGALPGKVLRSGRDTETVTVPAARG